MVRLTRRAVQTLRGLARCGAPCRLPHTAPLRSPLRSPLPLRSSLRSPLRSSLRSPLPLVLLAALLGVACSRPAPPDDPVSAAQAQPAEQVQSAEPARPANEDARQDARPSSPDASTDGAAGEAARASFDDPLPFDPAARVGMLDNGLRYIVREHHEPENRAVLRLIVEVGSLVEDEDQLGLAHFLEHMAFNGTERFERQQIIEFMQSIGMQVGADLNAATTFDTTTYMLTVPTDDPEHLETAFRIMEDWAQAMTLSVEEIEQERQIVLEEWRARRGAGARIADRHNPVLLEGSRYAVRMPIGTRESLEGFEHDALRRYYRDWYRPDLMAVVAVGDFDAAAVEQLVHRHFEGLEVPPDAPPLVEHAVPGHEDTRISIVTDPEITTSSVGMYRKSPFEPVRTVGDFRTRMIENFYSYMLQRRLQEIARRPDSPFRSATAGQGRLVRNVAVNVLEAQVPEDGIVRGLEALLEEAERAARFGFTESELDRVRQQVLREARNRYVNRETISSAFHAAEYASAIIAGQPVPSIEYTTGLIERFTPQITLDEVNAVAKSRLAADNRVVLVTAPEKEGVEVPGVEQVRAAVARAAQADLQPYEDAGADAVLSFDPPEPGEVVAEAERPGGVLEWQLSNGARVVVKPTDFAADEVLVMGFSPGGFSLVPIEDLPSAITAAGVVAAGGLANLDLTALQKALTGQVAFAEAGISLIEETITGRASVEDLDALFEMIYLRFTAPRVDEQAFQAYTSQLYQQLLNRERSPAAQFADAHNRIVYGGHPRRQTLRAEDVAEIDLERAHEIYRDRFADASDFTFVFVGSFDTEALRPLVEQYLAGLPALGREESARFGDVRFPEGVVEETVRAGSEPRSDVRISFAPPRNIERTPEELTRVGALTQVLEFRLRDVLREELGGTYGVGVSLVAYLLDDRVFAPAISFTADPQRIDALVERVFEEIDALQSEGPQPQRLAAVKGALARGHETALEQNGAWLNTLVESYRYYPDPGGRAMLERPQMIEALDAESLRDAAQQYFDTQNFVRVTLLPEG